VLHTEQEAGTADPADQNRHLHIARQYARRRRSSRSGRRGASMLSAGRQGRGSAHRTERPTRHAATAIDTMSLKFDHDMIWNFVSALDHGK
jgi:hypothetical protein